MKAEEFRGKRQDENLTVKGLSMTLEQIVSICRLSQNHQTAEFLIDEKISDMTQYLMEDYGYTLEKALDIVYRSHTMSLLQIEEAELYVQSSAYVYDLLIKELGLCPINCNQQSDQVAEDCHL